MTKLTKDERLVFEWLAKDDTNSYGECRGAAMDRLLELGIAEIGPELAAGVDEGFRRCWLSEYGWELFTDEQHALSDDGRF